jgi:hypothetical protein
MTMKRLLLLSTAVVLAASVSACQPKADKPGPQVIDVKRIDQDIKVLSSDAFEGRGPATAGETKSVDYISEPVQGGRPAAGRRSAQGRRAAPGPRTCRCRASVTQGPVKITATVVGRRRVADLEAGRADRHPRRAGFRYRPPLHQGRSRGVRGLRR